MFIEFISNDTITIAGWTASYTSVVPSPITGIVEYQYWYDTDFTGRITNSIMATDIYHLNQSLPTEGLNIGLHNFHIRFKDQQGHWSSIFSEVFYKQRPVPIGTIKIGAYEYWFDNAYASKTVVNVTPIQTYSLIDSLQVNSLQTGLHNFHIRFKDNQGQWSSVIGEVFYKSGITVPLNNLITGYRQWFDMSDTAMVTTHLPVPVNPFQLTTDIGTCNLTQGDHTIHFQFKDSRAYWSSVVTDTFNIAPQTIPISRTWIGVIDENWNKTGNWSPCGIPSLIDDVIISATAPFQPVVKISGLGCHDLVIGHGATVVINPGQILTVNGEVTLE